MQPPNKSNDTTPTGGLSDQAFDNLRKKLVDLVEPLNDAQLLDLADGIHELIRQRRTLRQNHEERMTLRRHGVDLRI